MIRQGSLTPPPATASPTPENTTATGTATATATDADAAATDTDDAEEEVDLSQLVGINYRKGTAECDEMVLLLATVKLGCREVRRTQLWNNFFSYMCCLIGATIVTRDSTMSQNDIYINAYTRYVSVLSPITFKSLILVTVFSPMSLTVKFLTLYWREARNS